jgi:hypothetical protein
LENNVLVCESERADRWPSRPTVGRGLVMDELQRLAIERALSILADDRNAPGSQETGTVEAARKILTGNKVADSYEFHTSLIVEAASVQRLAAGMSHAGHNPAG